MTDTEVEIYAMRQAQMAARTTRIMEHGRCRKMTPEETRQYAQALCGAISYFNRRDPEHAVAMRYRREMDEREARLQQRSAEAMQKPKPKVIVI